MASVLPREGAAWLWAAKRHRRQNIGDSESHLGGRDADEGDGANRQSVKSVRHRSVSLASR
ncbi:hypothetical protein ACN469_23230 [Corallococcus terminator]